jgi:hypothetical protein
MRKFSISLIFIFFICIDISFSQVNDSINIITENFRNFEYAEVIRLSEYFLRSNENLDNNQLIEIYTMKGIAHYSFGEDYDAKESFISILNLDSSFTLDPTRTSPKIITFYNEIKDEYIKNLSEINSEDKPSQTVRIDTVFIPRILRDVESENKLKNSLVRSLILPGLGHLYNGNTTKGWILTTLSVASIASTIYFVVDSNQKENEYLQERNRSSIEDKYDSYNISNSLKNFSIGSFVVVWLYSQVDLLFFSGNEGSSQIINLPSLEYFPNRGFEISYRFIF